MAIKPDVWIKRMAESERMIEPFSENQVRVDDKGEKLISYGVSSFGYDVRCANEFKVFTNIHSATVDPKVFDDWTKQDYTIDYLITKGLLKKDCKQHTDFDLIRVPSDIVGGREKLQYIKRVLANGFDNDKPNQIFYGNIHQVKGLTFDNVIVDHTMTRAEDFHTQLRLEYTAYSRGVFDYWELASTRTRKLGVRSI